MNKFGKIFLFGLAGLGIALSGCKGNVETTPPSVKELAFTSEVKSKLDAIKVGEKFSLKVNATYTDGSVEKDLSPLSNDSLKISAEGHASMDGKGYVKADSVGEFTLLVEYKGKKQTFDFTVKSADSPVVKTLTGITAQSSLTLDVGETKDLPSTVEATYSDGTKQSVSATYSTSDTGIISVTGNAVKGLAKGSATVKASYTEGGVTKEATVSVTVNEVVLPTDTLESLTLSKTSIELSVGETYDLSSITATAKFTTAGNTVVTPTYTSGNTAKATVTGNSLKGIAEGSVTVTASYEKNGVTKTAALSVTVEPAAAEDGSGNVSFQF